MSRWKRADTLDASDEGRDDRRHFGLLPAILLPAKNPPEPVRLVLQAVGRRMRPEGDGPTSARCDRLILSAPRWRRRGSVGPYPRRTGRGRRRRIRCIVAGTTRPP